MSLHRTIKSYQITDKLPIGSFLIVKLDAKNFKEFKKNINLNVRDVFENITQKLVKSSQALVAHTAQDEISLFYHDPIKILYIGNNSINIASALASKATIFFYELCGCSPVFSSTVYDIPRIHIIPYFVDRENYASRAIITKLAQTKVTYTELQNLNPENLKNIVHTEWSTLPIRDRFGIYLQNRYENEIKKFEIEGVGNIINRTDFLFNQKDPIFIKLLNQKGLE